MSTNSSFLGQELTYNSDDNTLVRFHSAAFGQSSHHGGGGTGSTTPSPVTEQAANSNLEFNLIWDSSVANAPSGFMTAVENAALYYSSLFTTSSHEVINIHVGWGEVNGQSLPFGAIGASESNGYLTNYSTVTSGLIASSGGVITSNSFQASNEPTGAQFFISSAEAKGFGLINPTSTAVDGYIGFGTGLSWNFTSSATTGQGSGTGTSQYDFQGVAQHEISEVMGRIEMEGHTTYNGLATYTPLDLFNFDGNAHLVVSGGDNSTSQVSSYFSIDSGLTPHGYFNDGYKGGDIADWASYSSYTQSQTGVSSGYQDAFDAFAYPSVNTDLSYSDQLVIETLGVSSTGVAIA
jgi:hypothetical protein